MSERSGPGRLSPDSLGEQSPHEAMPSRMTLLNIRQFQLQFPLDKQTNKKKEMHVSVSESYHCPLAPFRHVLPLTLALVQH